MSKYDKMEYYIQLSLIYYMFKPVWRLVWPGFQKRLSQLLAYYTLVVEDYFPVKEAGVELGNNYGLNIWFTVSL